LHLATVLHLGVSTHAKLREPCRYGMFVGGR